MSNKIKQTNTNGDNESILNIAIIGGGLVGSLAALHLGRKGHEINVYEYRDDIRITELIAGRSINLALSLRGRNALAEVDLEEKLLEHGIPMYGRMLHDLYGGTTIVPYDYNTNQCIYSVGRKYLNEVLLTATERYPNIHLNFNHKLINSKLEEGILNFINPKTKELTEVSTDLIIGCDGAFSTVRRQMLTKPGFNFSQKYIQHGYIELCIPMKNNDFAMATNYLHIWPRGKFMMIALPNQDKTWTVTLFMPFDNFNCMDTEEKLLTFFEIYFPDSIPLIGEERLCKDFFKVKPQTLISVKCRTYHLSSKVLLLGDAAHALVPFYGQGMNAGFEDCYLLSQILDKYRNDIGMALKEFSETRWEDAHAISDLAMYNYVEMRDLVTRKSYRLRKTLDDLLYRYFPNNWIPLYNSVSFSLMPYKKCVENREWQDKIIIRSLLITGSLFLGTFIYVGYCYFDKNLLSSFS